jgi:hypothetical protein
MTACKAQNAEKYFLLSEIPHSATFTGAPADFNGKNNWLFIQPDHRNDIVRICCDWS